MEPDELRARGLDAHEAPRGRPATRRREAANPIADSYNVIGQRTDVQQVGANALVDVERVTAVTLPSGVVFDVLVPVEPWERLGANTWIEPLATQIEYYFSSGQVSGARYEEDLDANGLVGFFIVFDVTIPPVPGKPPLENTAEVRVPLEALRERILINTIVQPAIDEARNALAFTADL